MNDTDRKRLEELRTKENKTCDEWQAYMLLLAEDCVDIVKQMVKDIKGEIR